ncbi:MAG: hypothetical protein AAGK21_17680 [Bacteroidota bacterium]
MPSPPIHISGIYEDAISTSQSGDSITSIVLRLSQTPDDGWTEAFHHEWALTSYPRKRNARVGSLRAERGPTRHGLVLFASPEDYIDKHKRHIEDAVSRANDRVRQRARQRDVTLADASRTIREINQAHYGDPSSRDPTSSVSVVRLAI